MTDEEQIALDFELVYAVKYRNINDVKKFIAAGANVNVHIDRTNLLIIAFSNYDLKMMDYLLKIGAKPHSDNGYSLMTTMLFFIPVVSDKYPFNIKTDENKNVFVKWMRSYEIQKFIIDKYPETISQFVNLKIINNEIRNEYQHLIQANELNLL